MTSSTDNPDNAPTSAGAGLSDGTTALPPPTGAAPELAWSFDNDDDTAPAERQSWRSAWGHATVLLSTAAVVAFVIAVVGWTIMQSGRDLQPLPPDAHPATVTAAAQLGGPEPTPTAPRPTLKGTYRLDFDDMHATINGNSSGSTHPHSTWWAFRSMCKPSGCVATGTQLDEKNHGLAQTEGGGDRAVFHFRDGRWQEAPDQTWDRCGGTAKTTVMAVVSVEPQPDGTLRGTETDTVVGNECNAQGTVIATPLVLTQIGDAPIGVVADPAFFD